MENENEITLVGKQQHVFTKGKSTATAGLLKQSWVKCPSKSTVGTERHDPPNMAELHFRYFSNITVQHG